MLITYCAIVVYILIWIIYYRQWNLILHISEKYNGLIAGWIFYVIQILLLLCYIILFIVSIKFRKSIKKTIFYTIMTVLFATFFAQNIFPSFDLYVDMNYKTHLAQREEVVRMFENDEMKEYQININTYLLPKKLKVCSHTSRVLSEKNDDNLKIIFYVYKGVFGENALLYVSDDTNLSEDKFLSDFSEVKKLDNCWYSIKQK